MNFAWLRGDGRSTGVLSEFLPPGKHLQSTPSSLSPPELFSLISNSYERCDGPVGLCVCVWQASLSLSVCTLHTFWGNGKPVMSIGHEPQLVRSVVSDMVSIQIHFMYNPSP